MPTLAPTENEIPSPLVVEVTNELTFKNYTQLHIHRYLFV